MEKTKKNISILCVSFFSIVAVTFFGSLLFQQYVKNINALWIKIAFVVALNLLNGFIAFVAMKLSKMKIDIDFKNKRQYLIGALLGIIFSLFQNVIPAFLGIWFGGEHIDFSWFALIYDFLFYMLIVGPVEEFIFRVYIQDAIVSLFEKNKWIGVVIASFLFGMLHIFNGGVFNVFIAFGFGLVVGFAKYKIKDCGYLGLALGHGLTDFSYTLCLMFIIQ